SLRSHAVSPRFPYTTLFRSLSRLIGEGVLERTSPRVLQLANFDRDALAASVSPLPDREARFRDLMELRYILEIGALPVIITKLTDRKSTRLNSSHVKNSYAV